MADDEPGDPERAAQFRRTLERELRRQITEELRPNLLREVEEDVRRRTRDEVREEIASRAPTTAERARFRALIADIDLDAYAQATVASREADMAEYALARSRRLGAPAVYAAALVMPVLGYGFGRWLSDPAAVGVALATLAIAFTLLVAATRRRAGQLEARAQKLRRVSSDFMIIAERGKAYRLVHAERIADASELAELVEGLRLAKEAQDRQFEPSTEELEMAREEMRHRIAERPALPRDEPFGARVAPQVAPAPARAEPPAQDEGAAIEEAETSRRRA